MKISKNRIIPDLSRPADKMKFLFLNFILFSSGLSLVGSFIYLLINIEAADRIIYKFLPGFTLGIVLLLVYFFLHENLVFRKKNFNQKTLSFRK